MICTMTKMLTLFGEDIGRLPYNDLKRERQVQQYLLTKLKGLCGINEYKLGNMTRPSQVAKDKVSLLNIYVSHLEALIEEADYWLDRKFEPESNYKGGHKSARDIRAANKIRHRQIMADDVRTMRLKQAIEKDSLYIAWDKERFLLVAKDRGYQTEEALIGDVAKELSLNRPSAKLLLERGRFTWGQVMCIGAMLEMTPKEFCDVFLPGYFANDHGEFRATHDNLDKWTLLQKPIRPDVIEVGADGRPIDEEEWFN